MAAENGVISQRKMARPSRDGWAEAARKFAAGGEALVIGEFGDEADAELLW
jgi:antitoxin MazE